MDNVRLNKFISEFQQMIAITMGYYGATKAQLPKRLNGKPFGTKGHLHHPCTVWARANKSNFIHMCRSTLEFLNEHHRRGGKGHANARENIRLAISFANDIPSGARTEFTNCAAHKDLGIDYKDVKCVHTAYMLYINDRWDLDKKEPKWIY
jgi:hypothetical protein